MQTGARRATSATGAKTGKGKNGEVIVEKVMTSDSFLSREIKKAPLIEHDGSLVADISHIPNDLKITIQGAREHNLKNVDLAIPRNRMVVFTGLSGSGKSSLAFDTIYAEGQRRYLETLSTYAPKASDATSNPYPPTPASSWVRWTSPTLTSSRA